MYWKISLLQDVFRFAHIFLYLLSDLIVKLSLLFRIKILQNKNFVFQNHGELPSGTFLFYFCCKFYPWCNFSTFFIVILVLAGKFNSFASCTHVLKVNLLVLVFIPNNMILYYLGCKDM